TTWPRSTTTPRASSPSRSTSSASTAPSARTCEGSAMRSNGLTAATYTPVADLDPAVAETLLEDLRAQGVAAYAKPVESTSAGGFDRPEFRVGVKERLYVDSSAAAKVRELIASVDPELLAANEDLTWAQLVAGYDRPLDDSIAPWPVDEDLAGSDADH